MTTPLSQLEDQKIQPVSIRSLRIDAIKQRCTPHEITQLGDNPLPFFTQKIIDSFNAHEIEKKTNPPKFTKVVDLKDVGFQFSLRIFLRIVNLTSGLGRSILKLNDQAPVQTCQTDYVGFLFRPGALFSFTTDQAWKVTHPYTDYSFPRQIATRLFDTAITSITFHELSGNIRRDKQDYKTPQHLELADYFFRYVIEANTHLRPDCSLFALKAFKETYGPSCEVHVGSVRFNTEISLAHFPEVFHHLATIRANQSTSLTTGKPEINSEAWNFWDHFTAVPAAVKKQLNHALEDTLYRAFQQGTSGPISLSHKLSSDFQKGSLILSSPKMKKSIHIASVIPVNELFDKIREFLRSDSQQHFIADLSTFSIEFKTGKDKEKSKLMKMFGGEIQLRDTGKTYIHLHGMWLSISGDYLAILEKRFRAIILEHFTLDPQITLPLPWPSDQEIAQAKQHKTGLYAEEIYNSRYKTQPGFLHGDRVLIEKIELFDLLRCIRIGTEIKYYLYHVKAGTGQTMRDVASQITVSAALIYDAIINQKTERLKEIYKAQKKYNPQALQENVGDLDTFLKTFKIENIVYVCALYVDSKKDRSLSDEPKLIETLSVADFNRFDNPTQIVQTLQREGYLSAEGRVTPKFKTETQQEFTRQINGQFPKAVEVRQHIKAIAVSAFQSLIARMELISLPKRIKFPLKICEIPKPKAPPPPQQQPLNINVNPPQLIILPNLVQPPKCIEGSCFRYQNTTYLIHPTYADNASALHALSEVLFDEQYYLRTARRDLMTEMQRDVADVTGKIRALTLQDAAPLSNRKLLDQKTKGNADRQRQAYSKAEQHEAHHWEMLKQKFLYAYGNISTRSRTTLKQKLVINAPNPSNDDLWNAFLQHYQAAYFFIRDNVPKSYNTQVIKYNDLIVDDQTKKAAAEAAINSEEFRQAYLACLQDEAYVIQQEELEIYAQLKEYRLLILSEDDHNQIVEVVPCQDPTHVLFRRGAHYSRCRKVED